MTRALAVFKTNALDWRDILHLAFEPGRASRFDIESVIDQADGGEWSGLWW